MKRTIALILSLSIVFALTGCSVLARYRPQENINMNYNNITANNSMFWLTNDTAYQVEGYIMTSRLFAVTEKGRKTIKCDDLENVAKVQAYGDTVYPLYWMGGSVYKLCSYEADSGNTVPLCALNELRTSFIIQEDLFYVQEYDDGTKWCSPFYMRPLYEDTRITICSSVLAAGVSNGKPVYLTQDESLFALYSYDVVEDMSTEIGSFQYDLKENEMIARHHNFTSKQVVLAVVSSEESKLLCYHFETGEVSVYPMDGSISSVIAYEDYAFAILTMASGKKNGASEKVLYRICLANGEMEEIGQLGSDLVNSFVTSDEFVYISTDSNPSIYRYDVSGRRKLVCNW